MPRWGWLIVIAFACGMNMIHGPVVSADDWPMWRYDATRSAASPDDLPAELQLAWRREFPPNHIAWGEDPRIQFDASLEPIVVGHTMLVASSTTDSVTALDTRSGKKRWKFFCDGPIRLPGVAWKGRAYFGADDGYFYCLDVSTGKLVWKFRAAPGDRRTLGNERLVSVWPIRGGAVIDKTPDREKLYFTAGVWPFEGALLYTVDLQKSTENPHYIAKILTDLSPQGVLMLSGGRLYIPGGRAKASCLDLKTGKFVSLNYDSRGLTDYHVAGAGQLLFHGAKVHHTSLNRMMPITAPRPVSDGEMVYTHGPDQLLAYDMTRRKTTPTKDRKGNTVHRDQVPIAWELAVDELTPSDQTDQTDPTLQLHVKAGKRLYGNRGQELFAIDLPDRGGKPRISWKTSITGRPSTMLAADDRLFVVTQEGQIHCFGGQVSGSPQTFPLVKQSTRQQPQDQQPQDQRQQKWTHQAENILRQANDHAGYCLVIGVNTGELIQALAEQSSMRIIAVDSDPQRVQKVRQQADAAGIYGTKVTAIVGDPQKIALPPYLATLLVSETPRRSGLFDPRGLKKAFQHLRPYGGVLALPQDDEQFNSLDKTVRQAKLPQGKLSRDDGVTVLKREGALPGSADWTHEYGDASNTLMSHDQRVKAPLGVLWFGGPASSGELFFNRHYWAPGLTVVEGRMFVQGPERLAAIDIYTGRVLWKIKMRKGSGPGRRGTFFEKEKPGYHFVAVKDSVYLVYPDVCLRLDPRSGKTVSQLKPPSAKDQWGKMRVWNDLLIGTVFRQHGEMGLVPRAITAIHRESGQLVWSEDAVFSIPLMAVGGDKVFFFDGYLTGFYDAWKRKGLVPKAAPVRFLKAIDARTGKPVWEQKSARVATWLAYSEDHDMLVASNKKGMSALRGASGESVWQNEETAPGFGGHPENVWDKVILAGDEVIDQRGPGRAYHLLSGAPAMDRHPVSGEPTPWRFTKTGHHCNYAIASPHLVTFRAGVAGFFDRNTNSTGRLAGFRSGCRNSLIPAGGVLNAPNYAHGCICSYNLFTSLALVHVPEADLWTYNAYEAPTAAPRRLGINFGAPGDRLSSTGTLWMEYPRTGDPSAKATLEVNGPSLRPFRLHTAQVQADKLGWVTASGIEGVTDLRIILSTKPVPAGVYTVRLFFLEPAQDSNQRDENRRVFDVSLQGQRVLPKLDVSRQADGPRKLLLKEFTGVAAESEINVSFTKHHGEPLINGIEVIAEEPSQQEKSSPR